MVKIELRVIRHKDGEKNWFSYKGLTKDGKWVDVKFTKEVEKLPQHPCYIHVLPENVNRENPNAVKYPKVWIKQIESTSALLFDRQVEDFKPYTPPKANDLFGGVDE